MALKGEDQKVRRGQRANLSTPAAAKAQLQWSLDRHSKNLNKNLLGILSVSHYNQHRNTGVQDQEN